MKVVRSRRAVMAALLALALPLTLAACGNDDEDTDAQVQDEGTTEEQTPSDGAGELIHVSGTEYEFEGIPASLAPGSYTFHFENTGEEQHELLLFKLNTDTPVEELIKMPQKKAMKEITPVGGVFAEPGETAEQPLEADLEAGNYAAVCFVSSGKNDPPHAFRGMIHELTVE